ncbi:MAG: hypothetical protein NUV69_00690 [Candidatus Curtissbacteria bacterium]|nr:hypothetical protein [Candidatus Curtissbacteria bacterium]
MIINPGSKIADIPALQARLLLRAMNRACNFGLGFDEELVVKKLNVSKVEAKKVIQKLIKEGFVETETLEDKWDRRWKTTIKGNAYSQATSAKPILRATANKNLLRFVTRVKEVSMDPYWLHKPAKIVIFGSYLSEKPRLGDIDIAMDMVRKNEYMREEIYDKLRKKKLGAAYAAGKQFNTYVDTLFWPYTETMNYLKSKDRTLSIRNLEEERHLVESVKHEIIWENDKLYLEKFPGITKLMNS